MSAIITKGTIVERRVLNTSMISLDNTHRRTAVRIDSVSIITLLTSLLDAVATRRRSSVGCIRTIIDIGVETACSTIESVVANTDTG